MSKWGIEEKETLDVIHNIGFHGNILNIAAGDGRFNNELLKLSDKLMAIDINESELDILKRNCLIGMKNKLYTKKVDITKTFPFENSAFDGVFCTGALHLFKEDIITNILDEIKRVLKVGGVIVLDFATEISRLDIAGNKVVFEGEGNYTNQQALNLFKNALAEFNINIETFSFKEENLDSDVGYKFINGKFLIISGRKK